MTMKHIAFVFALAGCGAMAACSTPTEITTTDGQTTVSSDKPQVDEDTGFVKYEKNGQEVQVNKSEVRDMKPVE